MRFFIIKIRSFEPNEHGKQRTEYEISNILIDIVFIIVIIVRFGTQIY